MADETSEISAAAKFVTVRIVALKREEFTVDVSDAALVSDLKKKIEQEKATFFPFDPSTHLELMYAEKVLKDEDAIKSVYDPNNKAAIVAVIEKPLATSGPAASAESKPVTDSASKNADGSKNYEIFATTAESHQPALEQNGVLIKNDVEMGYPRAPVERLFYGAIGAIGTDVGFGPNDLSAAALTAMAAAALEGVNDDDDEGETDGPVFEFPCPTWELLKQMGMGHDPAKLPQLIQQIGTTMPSLMQIIQENQEGLTQFFKASQPPAGEAAVVESLGVQSGAGASVGSGGTERLDNGVVVSLTQADRNAIDSLKNLG